MRSLEKESNKCPTCGAHIRWTSELSYIQCEYCDSTYKNKNFKEITESVIKKKDL